MTTKGKALAASLAMAVAVVALGMAIVSLILGTSFPTYDGQIEDATDLCRSHGGLMSVQTAFWFPGLTRTTAECFQDDARFVIRDE